MIQVLESVIPTIKPITIFVIYFILRLRKGRDRN